MVIRSYGPVSKFFQLDGLLLFCIIMGLCSASSTIIRLRCFEILETGHEFTFFMVIFVALILSII